MKRARKDIFIIILVIIVVFFSTFVRFKIIKGSLPYVGHPDEPGIAKTAVGILQTGDFNPGTFMYPSLPYYLTAASMVFGYVNSVSKREIRNTKEIGSLAYPYFSEQRLIFPSKLLFTLLSLIGMVLSGIIAYNFLRNKHLIYLVPLLLSLSVLYLYHSSQYLNVDIIACFFALLTIFYVTKELKNDSFLAKAILPGILCGLATASKYNYLLVIMPAALSIIFYSKKQILKKILVLSVITIIAFLICVPYSILDLNKFLDDIGLEIYTYESGHPGFTGNPGLSQFFFYGKALINEYGFGFMAFAILGIFYSLISNIKKGMILLSFPLIILAYMSAYPINFLRNILVVYIFVCMYCAFGIIVVFKYLSVKLNKLPFFSNKKIFQPVVPVLFAVIVILVFLPVQEILNAYDLKPDSRNLAIAWIESNAPFDSKIFVPEELGLDTRKLENHYEIRHFDGLKSKARSQEFLPGSYVLIPYYGYDDRHPEAREISEKLNKSLKNFNRIVLFGKRPVLVNYPAPSPMGNPRFYIVKIQ